MESKKNLPGLKIPKTEAEVKPWQSLNDFYKEKAEGLKKPIRPRSWWIRIPKKWWFEDLSGLSFSERCVLISLKLHADKQGKCFPSLRTMAQQLKVNPHTILKAVRNLEKKGFVKIVVVRGRFNSYFLNGSSC